MLKAVLRRRDAIQMEYDATVDELNKRKDEREQVMVKQKKSFVLDCGKMCQIFLLWHTINNMVIRYCKL